MLDLKKHISHDTKSQIRNMEQELQQLRVELFNETKRASSTIYYNNLKARDRFKIKKLEDYSLARNEYSSRIENTLE